MKKVFVLIERDGQKIILRVRVYTDEAVANFWLDASEAVDVVLHVSSLR